MMMVMVVIIAVVSCSKDEGNDPTPVEKKKCAWIAGWQDSTGYGTILYSADAGETWIRQGLGNASLQGVDLDDIWALDEDIVWTVGTKNTILRTQNGGQGWIRIQAPATMPEAELESIFFHDHKNIWICGGLGIVYNSKDGGNTWTMIDTSNFQKAGLQGIWGVTSQRIFAVGGVSDGFGGERGFVAYTIDGGTTWATFIPSGDFNRWQWIGVVSYGNTVVIHGGASHYMVSLDQGETWRNDSVPGMAGGARPADINDLIMLDELTWWGACDEGHICFTTDGGSNWTIQETGQGGFYLVGINAWDSQLALAVGTEDGPPGDVPILKTSNGGALWEVKDRVNSNLSKVTFIR